MWPTVYLDLPKFLEKMSLLNKRNRSVSPLTTSFLLQQQLLIESRKFSETERKLDGGDEQQKFR